MADNQEFVGQQRNIDQRVGDLPNRLIRLRPDDRGVGIELDIDVETRQLGKLGGNRRPLLWRGFVLAP